MRNECLKKIDDIKDKYDQIFSAIENDDRIKDLIEEYGYADAKWATRDEFDRIISEIETMFEKGKLLLFREICINDVDEFIKQSTICKKGAGIYWTDDARYAESYWCPLDYNYRITLEATARCEDVNLFDTISSGIVFDFNNEREIRLNEGSELFLERIHFESDLDIPAVEMGVRIFA